MLGWPGARGVLLYPLLPFRHTTRGRARELTTMTFSLLPSRTRTTLFHRRRQSFDQRRALAAPSSPLPLNLPPLSLDNAAALPSPVIRTNAAPLYDCTEPHALTTSPPPTAPSLSPSSPRRLPSRYPTTPPSAHAHARRHLLLSTFPRPPRRSGHKRPAGAQPVASQTSAPSSPSSANPTGSPIHTAFSSQSRISGSASTVPTPSSPYQFTLPSTAGSIGGDYVPQRAAPAPPSGSTSYSHSSDSPNYDGTSSPGSAHVVGETESRGVVGGRRGSVATNNANAVRSSYVPGSRPYGSGAVVGSGSSSSLGSGGLAGAFVPSRPPPPPPSTVRVLGLPASTSYSSTTNSPSSSINNLAGYSSPVASAGPLSHPSSPARKTTAGSGIGGTPWELVDEEPLAPPKRPAPPALTSSLRDIADALPASSPYHNPTYLPSSSTPFSTSMFQSTSAAPANNGLASYSLGNDAPTSTTSSLTLQDESVAPPASASAGWGGPAGVTSPGAGVGGSEWNAKAAGWDSPAAAGLTTGTVGRERGDSNAGGKEKGSTIKNVLGSFLCESHILPRSSWINHLY